MITEIIRQTLYLPFTHTDSVSTFITSILQHSRLVAAIISIISLCMTNLPWHLFLSIKNKGHLPNTPQGTTMQSYRSIIRARLKHVVYGLLVMHGGWTIITLLFWWGSAISMPKTDLALTPQAMEQLGLATGYEMIAQNIDLFQQIIGSISLYLMLGMLVIGFLMMISFGDKFILNIVKLLVIVFVVSFFASMMANGLLMQFL